MGGLLGYLLRKRKIKLHDGNGTRYMPFDGDQVQKPYNKFKGRRGHRLRIQRPRLS